MNRHLCSALVILLVITACSSPKEKIVERQKQITSQLAVLTVKASAQKTDAVKIIRDNRGNLSDQKVQSKYNEVQDSIAKMEERKMYLQVEYDSLSSELKKY